MKGLFRFHGGINPTDYKAPTRDQPIIPCPVAPRLILPLQQPAGPIAIPSVCVGATVFRGQSLAYSDSPFGRALHAPCDGVIESIGDECIADSVQLSAPCIVIKTAEHTPEKNKNLPVNLPVEITFLSVTEMVQRLQNSGITGLGGAGFPSHAKLFPFVDNTVKHLIINGAECEPYISCDDRLMREHATVIAHGIQALQKILKPEKMWLAIEDNKPEAIAAMQHAINHMAIDLRVIPTLYPSGAQKTLIQLLLNQEIPRGTHSVDAGILMFNVGTCHAIANALLENKPLTQRIVTVSGNAVTRPGNYDVPIGTPLSFLLGYAGLQREKLAALIHGGPLMGFTVRDANAPVTQLSNCLIAADAGELNTTREQQECIRCGDCMDVCPAVLLPQQLYWFIKTNQLEKAENLSLSACIECGACAYVCPSQLPLVSYYRFGKSEVRRQRIEKEKAATARQRYEKKQIRLTRIATERDTARVTGSTVPPESLTPHPVTQENSAPETLTQANKQAVDASRNTATDNIASIIDSTDKSAEVAAAVARARARKANLTQKKSEGEIPPS